MDKNNDSTIPQNPQMLGNDRQRLGMVLGGLLLNHDTS